MVRPVVWLWAPHRVNIVPLRCVVNGCVLRVPRLVAYVGNLSVVGGAEADAIRLDARLICLRA